MSLRVRKRTPRFSSVAAQLRGVVDLAVVDNDDRLVFVGHRLVTVSNVNDGQTSHSQGRVRMRSDTPAIRPAMPDACDHGCHKLAAPLDRTIERDET